MVNQWMQVIKACAEVCFFLFFAHKQHMVKSKKHCLYMIPLLISVYVLLQLNTLPQIWDILIKVGMCGAFLRYLYGLRSKRALFLALVFYLTMGIGKSIISKPILIEFNLNLWTMIASSDLRAILETGLILFSEAVLLVIARFCVQREKESDISVMQLALSIVACMTYGLTRKILRSYSASNTSVVSIDITLSMIALCIAILAIVLFSEYYFASVQREKDVHRLEQVLHMQYENHLHQQEADRSVREMYHDIKNHLGCISRLAQNEKIQEYVDSINKEISTYDSSVHTGNAVLDIVLHQKTVAASRKAIRLEVFTNFSTLDFMEYSDICSIFSNALDNAIEASENLPESTERIIQLKINELSGVIAISISNPYEGVLIVKEDGKFETRKADNRYHGIGLASIVHSIQKYGGDYEISTEDNQFVLSMMLPIQAAG